MTQDELKQAVANAALDYVVDGHLVGVGTGSTARCFIEALASIKHRITGAVASSEDTRRRLEGHGIKVFDLNEITDLPVYPLVGFFVAPADAQPSVLRQADLVLKHKGGSGAIRELTDQLLGILN